MPFDEQAADRVRKLFRRREGSSEKKMFGGLGFLLHGKMCCGVWNEYLILRLGPEGYLEALEEPGVRPFDITGRPMRGWVMVEPEGYEEEEKLRSWVRRAALFASTLPK